MEWIIAAIVAGIVAERWIDHRDKQLEVRRRELDQRDVNDWRPPHE